MRAVSVAFSPARPSRLKKEPGILPAAYIRSSTSTVSGRKSTSRRLPAVAVQRTTVSPERTTTAPEACLASLPVSNEISLPSISTDTRVTASLIFNSLPPRPSVGGVLLVLIVVPNVDDGSGVRAVNAAGRGRSVGASQPPVWRRVHRGEAAAIAARFGT